MKTLTHSAFIQALASHSGAAFVGLDTLTDSRARKTGNPFGTIYKQARFVGTIGADYGAALNRETNGAAFEVAPLPWGEWYTPGKVISHKGGFYLRTQTIGKQRKARPAVVKYRDASGKFLSRKDVAPFIPAPSHSVKQEAVGLSDSTVQVQPRNFAFDSILRVRFNGQTFKLIPG